MIDRARKDGHLVDGTVSVDDDDDGNSEDEEEDKSTSTTTSGGALHVVSSLTISRPPLPSMIYQTDRPLLEIVTSSGGYGGGGGGGCGGVATGSGLRPDSDPPTGVCRKKKKTVEFCHAHDRKFSIVSWIRRDSRKLSGHLSDTNNGPSDDNDDSSIRRGSDLMSLFARPRSCNRLVQPRLSLHGRPIYVRHIHQRDPRYRRFQIQVHNILERPRGFLPMFYHLSL